MPLWTDCTALAPKKTLANASGHGPLDDAEQDGNSIVASAALIGWRSARGLLRGVE
jgi:hypothetical protein